MQSSVSRRKLDVLKTKLIDGIFFFGTILGAALFLLSLFPLGESSFNFDFYSDVTALLSLLAVTLVRDKLSLSIKASVILFALFLFVNTDILQYGISSTDKTLMVLIPFTSILAFEARTTLLLFCAAVINYLVLGYLISQQIFIPTVHSSPLDHNFLIWLESIGIISIVSFAITLFVYRYNETISRVFIDLEEQNEKLAERELLLSRITNGIPRSWIIVVDKDLVIRFAGGEGFNEREFPAEAALQRNLWELLVDEENQLRKEVCDLYKRTFDGDSRIGEFFIAGEHMLIKTIPLKNSTGQIYSVLGLTENISERVKKDTLIQNNLEEKNILLQEIHHRVKNNLAVVSGLLDLQSYHLSDNAVQHILKKSTNRILSIAKVHEMLYEAKDFSRLPFDKYIRELSDIILASMNSDNQEVTINTDIGIKNLNINHGVPLGIIFNELITNSVKYGFPQQSGNEITITVSPRDTNIEVVYEDNGVGIHDFEAASTKSLGFTLIEALMEQIQAEYAYDTENRFKLTFTFPSILETGPYHLSDTAPVLE
jgi:two-component sensor histidine kinase